jgi:hypothetical protein
MNIVELRTIVDSVKCPTTNDYYEYYSQDGYSMLAMARHRVGLEYHKCSRIISSLRCGLNSDYIIKGEKIPANSFYVYTATFAYLFYKMIAQNDTASRIAMRINSLPRHADGSIQYCTTSIRYKVPNVSALATMIFAVEGTLDDADELIETLRANIINGNWKYTGTSDVVKWENSFHVAMMVWALREAGKHGVIVTDIVRDAIRTLAEMNKSAIESQMGRNAPWLMLACKGMDKELYSRALAQTMKESVVHTNFRTRALAVWALTMTEAVGDG